MPGRLVRILACGCRRNRAVRPRRGRRCAGPGPTPGGPTRRRSLRAGPQRAPDGLLLGGGQRGRRQRRRLAHAAFAPPAGKLLDAGAADRAWVCQPVSSSSEPLRVPCTARASAGTTATSCSTYRPISRLGRPAGHGGGRPAGAARPAAHPVGKGGEVRRMRAWSAITRASLASVLPSPRSPSLARLPARPGTSTTCCRWPHRPASSSALQPRAKSTAHTSRQRARPPPPATQGSPARRGEPPRQQHRAIVIDHDRPMVLLPASTPTHALALVTLLLLTAPSSLDPAHGQPRRQRPTQRPVRSSQSAARASKRPGGHAPLATNCSRP
jgi:hypothetical protein